MTTDLQIQSGVAEVLYPIQRADASHVVPRTTLTAPTVANTSTSISLTDPTILTIGSSVSFADALGERRQYVASGSGGTPWTGANPVPLDFTLRGFTALQQSHLSGTVVYTNLFDTTPWDIASGLSKGAPVIFVRAMQAATRQIAMPAGNYTTFQVDVQYHRLLNAPGEENGVRINANAWADTQERLARGDVALITAGLLADQTLLGTAAQANHSAYAKQMAPLNSAGDKITVRWRSETTVGDTTHLYAVLTAIYVALP